MTENEISYKIIGFVIKKLRITLNKRMLRQSINLLILWQLQKK